MALLTRSWHAASSRCRPPCAVRSAAARTTVARPFVASAVVHAEKKNWLLTLLGYYGDESTRIRNAEALLQSCANQAGRKAWFGRGRALDEFRPKHALLMTHVWLVHKRLMGDAESAACRFK